MELKQNFTKGQENAHLDLNNNFKQLTDNASQVTQSIDTLNIWSSQINRTQGFGFGLEGTITRVGNLVIATCMANQRNPQGDDSKFLAETIPAGFRPSYNVSVKSLVYVGSAYQDTRHHRLIFSTDGRIQVVCKNMAAAPLEVSFSVVWITADPIPSN